MLFGQIALSFILSPATISPVTVRDFIIAKHMPLCGSIGAWNDTVGATLTAGEGPNFAGAGTVAKCSDQHLNGTSVISSPFIGKVPAVSGVP
jgi:hypothetical protein